VFRFCPILQLPEAGDKIGEFLDGKHFIDGWSGVGSPSHSRILPTVLQSGFTQDRLFGASWFAFAVACQVSRPLCRSDQNSSGHRGFYLQASNESVSLLVAGYNYYSHWTVLLKGLSPFGMPASVAAPSRSRPHDDPVRYPTYRARIEGGRDAKLPQPCDALRNDTLSFYFKPGPPNRRYPPIHHLQARCVSPRPSERSQVFQEAEGTARSLGPRPR
jgi:hypothetical protein